LSATREHREIERGELERLRLRLDDVHAERCEQPEMHPVSAARGVSWLPATITTSVLGSAARSRANWRYACRIAVFVGRT
jgi:hypothetical protein